MDHALTVEGFGVRLRPVRRDDAAFIVWLRNLDYVKGRVGDSATDVASQEAWLDTYFKREGDYYFLVETLGGISVGTYGIYDQQGACAEPGRWIIRPDVPAAIPSVMLAFDAAFDKLGLSALQGTTVATNHKVLSLNVKLGFKQVRIERAGRIIGGKPVDMIHFVLTSNDWAKARERLLPLAELAGNQVREWERAQKKGGHPAAKNSAN